MMTPLQLTLRETIEVARPMRECIAFVADFSTVQDWDPGVAHAHRTSDGPIAAGSTFEVMIQSGFGPFKNRFPMHYMLTELTDDTVVLSGTSAQVDGVDTITFAPSEIAGQDCTKISYRADLSIKQLPQWARPVIGPAMRRMGRKAVQGLYNALAPRPAPKPDALRNLGDYLIVPGALRFTRFGAGRQATVDRLDGQTVVLTGPTAGLGKAAAQRLAELGAHLVLVGRDADKLAAVRQHLIESTGNAEIDCEVADLAELAAVKALIARLNKRPRIDALINNAGALFNTRQETGDGLERSFAVNLLAPALLAEGLKQQLGAAPRGRVVNVVSGGMYLSGLDLDDLQYTQRDYDGTKSYAQAKRGLFALTRHWADTWPQDDINVAVHAMHPGWADTPGVADALPGFKDTMQRVLRTPEDGADTMVWLAANPAVQSETGQLWLDRKPHTATILPGTGVSADDAAALHERLLELGA